MPVNFPDSPALNEVYAYESRSWKWNGKAWVAISAAYGPTGPAGAMQPGDDAQYVLSLQVFS